MAVLAALIYGILAYVLEEPASFQDEVTRELICPSMVRVEAPCETILAEV